MPLVVFVVLLWTVMLHELLNVSYILTRLLYGFHPLVKLTRYRVCHKVLDRDVNVNCTNFTTFRLSRSSSGLVNFRMPGETCYM